LRIAVWAFSSISPSMDLLAVRCLLIEPFAESALNEEAGRLLLEDYDDFFRQAQLMTQVHAMPAKRPIPLGTRQGMANTAPHSPDKSAPQPEHCSSPVTKKAKAATKGAGVAASAAAKQRALKRL
jgi:ubiquitin-conjugating enzyme E2 S